ncbi:hypothetical protein BDB00DRAFT_929473 [Zychaea mexicana]|uniref:uncharacterized protein n=1 Tax=Zychaea mexicana TaxID=64656 RepID=UPI0022FF21B7|nr:uncharacterized protein BDB00DRAFT_929473 [Zychaea mexicana]KAI9492852.1 hypothetical protein BDB00DRAFT_929473 [Zychaea mexicana]
MLRSTAGRALFRANRSHNYITRSNAWKRHYEIANRTSLGASRSLSHAAALRNTTTDTATKHAQTTTTTVQGSSLKSSTQNRPDVSSSAVLETIASFAAKSDARGAARYFQGVQNTQLGEEALTAETYTALIRLVRQSGDVDLRNTVCRWFYLSRENSPLSKAVFSDIDVWTEALKLGLKQGKVLYSTDLSMLVTKFTRTFKMQDIENVDTLNILTRAYGILDKPESIAPCLKAAQKHAVAGNTEPVEAAILAYATCGWNTQVKQLLTTIGASESFLAKLSRTYAFKGDIAQTRIYVQQSKKLSSNYQDNGTILLAHKSAIEREYIRQIQHALNGGYNVRFRWNERLRALQKSWDAELALGDSNMKDVFQCNYALDYLSKAHIMNPTAYPMEKLESFVREKMPTQGVKPNDYTYTILLRTYSRSQQYVDDATTNTRLNKTLDLFQEIQRKDKAFDVRIGFHALYSACIPHQGNNYPFDYFLYFNNIHSGSSNVPRRLNLDRRFFDIEKIMLGSRIRYDKKSLILALTCLGTSGQYRAMWNRWHLVKQSGLKRDNALYRHIFALASMNKEQSQYALSVIKEELVRELAPKSVTWSTYVAMLDCCITAQDPNVARQILATMPKSYGNTSQQQKNELVGYYEPMLRACTMIKGLEAEADQLFEQVHSKEIPYNHSLWRAAMYQAVRQGGEIRGQKVQQLFTQYTMQRFEQLGKIPIPIRETAPVAPFPSGPYSTFDMHMIDLYVASLVDSQDVSLALDVFKTLKEEQPGKLRLSSKTVGGFVQLAKREKSDEDLKWLKESK